MARAVGEGRKVGEALRYLDSYGSAPDAHLIAAELAFFLVARCESHHAGWRVLRQVVVDSSADAPWEKCARRAVPVVEEDLLRLYSVGGRTPLSRAQHIAAQRRAEEIAPYVDQRAVLDDLGFKKLPVASEERWEAALAAAVSARSREGVARAVGASLKGDTSSDGARS
jgi:hypothetical protein